MPSHPIASRDDWLAARRALLAEEKELTRRSDELAKKRVALPWVAVGKSYDFQTETGPATLADLFQGRSQLLIYHFMYGPDYQAGCPSCSAIADGFDGTVAHFQNHDVSFWAVSRAPLDRLLTYRDRMGWEFPWASSLGSDFNFDFGVSFTAEQQRDGMTYNFETEGAQNPEAVGGEVEMPGMSSFVIEDGQVYHCYSAYARGLDAMWSVYPWLDRAPLGRNEPEYWWRRQDEYPKALASGACCQNKD
ncbi:DUF899 domain-containing protein [Paracoccus albus]|uniref:DUF899 domain-containing protein n=1 Tax=Paracoccus albus TaxID=3017784 RepID=UPI0022F0C43B|nr:DUF899 domain-containing protein [Paracoccus albus]WBU60409.1 DUF899 domain-containing protein [Paracoccus albus]